MTAAETGGADLPARSRGVIGLLEENCTVCMLCARECPDWCIYIESHKEAVVEPGAVVGPGVGAARSAAPTPAVPAASSAIGPASPGAGPPGRTASDRSAGRGRPRVRNVLDRFAIDYSLCMYCGICVEVCPYDALFWSPEFAYPATDIADLTHERDRLRDWMWTVPPPPAHDAGAPAPREVLAAGIDEGPGVP